MAARRATPDLPVSALRALPPLLFGFAEQEGMRTPDALRVVGRRRGHAGGMQLRNRLDRLTLRRSLRRQLTHAEAILWRELQGRRLENHRFRRQFSVGPYILDFYCPSARLAIELDGDAHDNESAQRHDESRDAFMTRHGIRTLRFRNDDVRHRLDDVLIAIAAELSPPVAKR